jgi:NADPH:quinone reductase-like Zn-dependent oxidoreductase
MFSTHSKATNRFAIALALSGLLCGVPALANQAKLPASMRKVVLEQIDSGFGWKVIEVPVPTPGDHQVLVHVRAVGLNNGELSRLKPSTDPNRAGRVPASDAAGEVVAIGKQVKDVRIGDRVVSMYFKDWAEGPYSRSMLDGSHGWRADGVLADYIALDTQAVAPIPEGWTYEQAATLPTAGLTAWNAVTRHGGVHPGDVVLVQGTGGVSTFALQFAAAAGARVIVTSSADEKLQRAKALGAQAGINYEREPAWSERVVQLTDGHGADLVVDIGGKSTLEESTKSLADGGKLAIVGGMSGYDGNIAAWGLLEKSAQAHGVFVGSRAEYLRMREFLSKHSLKPVIERVYPLAQFPDALQRLASGNFVGKIVLRME